MGLLVSVNVSLFKNNWPPFLLIIYIKFWCLKFPYGGGVKNMYQCRNFDQFLTNSNETSMHFLIGSGFDTSVKQNFLPTQRLSQKSKLLISRLLARRPAFRHGGHTCSSSDTAVVHAHHLTRRSYMLIIWHGGRTCSSSDTAVRSAMDRYLKSSWQICQLCPEGKGAWLNKITKKKETVS